MIAIHSEIWKQPGKTRGQWQACLRDHAYPRIGEKGVDQVTTADVMSVLLPLWTRRHATARKLRQREEIDFSAVVWTIPATRMKASRQHRVPLCARAVEILHAAARLRRGSTPLQLGGLVFLSARGKELADARLSKLLDQLGIGAVPHGFRSSFRDWVSERTNHPREVVEAALAHVVRNQTEAAYARSDLFDRRRQLMTDWMQYLDPKRSPRPIVV